MADDEKSMRCIECGGDLIKNDAGVLECEGCGWEMDEPDKPIGFIHYGQAGMEGFSVLTIRELAEWMGEEEREDTDHYLGLFVEQYHLGTGAIEVYATESTLKDLKEAVAFVEAELARKKKIAGGN